MPSAKAQVTINAIDRFMFRIFPKSCGRRPGPPSFVWMLRAGGAPRAAPMSLARLFFPICTAGRKRGDATSEDRFALWLICKILMKSPRAEKMRSVNGYRS
jgi:hypothetical protein